LKAAWSVNPAATPSADKKSLLILAKKRFCGKLVTIICHVPLGKEGHITAHVIVRLRAAKKGGEIWTV
jgi:hypothetical protein